MTENGLVTIGKLIKIMEGKSFFVDSYQRGYKWDIQQVEDLLNDIDGFEQFDDPDSFYCIQPIVVKYIDGDSRVELIDGQQRMTTIYIILSFLEKRSYLIDYQTREESALFLKNYIGNNSLLSVNFDITKGEEVVAYLKQNDSASNLNNIDNYHFVIAFKTIQKWFGDNLEKKESFYKKLTDLTKVIWYKPLGVESAQQLFARINIGKIPLTNSELIKGLFLSHKSLSEFEKHEMAYEWDRIETILQNDEFFYFVSDNKAYPSTRIDLIFDLVNKRKFNDEKIDKLWSYRELSSKLQNANHSSVIELWEQTIKVFSAIENWYNDLELFHLVGRYLYPSCKSNVDKNAINKLLEIAKGSKNDFLQFLRVDSNTVVNEKYKTASYDNKVDAHEILLLFNLNTSTLLGQRFSFYKYKITNWSIEHIHAQNTDDFKDLPQKIEWINGAKETLVNLRVTEKKEYPEIEKKLFEMGEISSKTIDDDFNKLFYEFNKTIDPNSSSMHALSNLALLDGPTNSSIGKGFFYDKRINILSILEGKKKSGEKASSPYIPICTQHVFSKLYTQPHPKFYIWDNTDRESYIKKIKEILKINN